MSSQTRPISLNLISQRISVFFTAFECKDTYRFIITIIKSYLKKKAYHCKHMFIIYSIIPKAMLSEDGWMDGWLVTSAVLPP